MRRQLIRDRQVETHKKESFLMLVLGALGVVYGDIGTSPLYALRECFSQEHGLALTQQNIYGILSLIFWTLFIVISVKYVLVVMRADNKGEGGILSIMALASGGQSENTTKRKIFLTIIGLFGAALLYGDGAITPAISVLSAVEGLEVMTPFFKPYILPATISIIVLLFLAQRFGTARIGYVFGPIMLMWFLTLAGLGIYKIYENPQILKALSPHFAIQFFIENQIAGLLVLGSVFLVVTGGEALYADMGHFGLPPIKRVWFFLAFPALTLNYFGQGALLLNNPEAIKSPFYFLAPEWALGGLVLLATLATVIASQALISGAYSITKQAIQLGFLPRLKIIHTSSREMGQIYVPVLNWALMIGVVWLVIEFKSSSSLANAYGVAVTGTMTITTLLAYEVARRTWNWGRWKAGLIFGSFLIIDLAFLSSNLIKIENGGWIPLAIGAVIYLLMSTWRKGRSILAIVLKSKSIPMNEFIKNIEDNPPLRIPGNAIYMSSDIWGAPIPLLHNLKHNKVLHNQVALLTFKTLDVPFVPQNERITLDSFAPSFYRIIAHYGFMETPKIKHILEACREKGIHFPIQETTFVLGRETILPKGTHNLSVWREKIFAFMSRNAERPSAFFKIPPNQVIEVGIQVEI